MRVHQERNFWVKNDSEVNGALSIASDMTAVNGAEQYLASQV